MPRRMIDFEGLVNCRDLGGLALENSGVTRSGVLFRSETPQLMTQTDVQRAQKEFGIGRVVDLRGNNRFGDGRGSGPLGDEGRGFNIDFVDLVGGVNAIDQSVNGFFPNLIESGAKPLKVFLEYFVDTDAAVLVHCHTGKDRTGFIVALTLALVGVRDDEIIADYAMSGPIFETMKSNLAKSGLPMLPTSPVFAHHPPSVESITELFRRLRTRWSSPQAWAVEHGIDRELIDRTRRRLAN